jgi:alkylation response protein AidB-like acyl-CoA dehydrogenase
MTAPPADLERFRGEARAWLERHAEPKPAGRGERDREQPWGHGSDSVAVFPTAAPEEERSRVKAASEWQRLKFDAGYGAITWPQEYGGAGLSPAFERAFRSEERRFVTPEPTELFPVTIGLVAPTIARHGTDHQKHRFIRPLLRTDLLACQLFSEPGAGSDLASLSCRAERDGDGWVLNGQKVWSSGATLADYGEAICRTDPALPRHQGMTAFLVPLDAEGVEVRPIRQMTGGASFNEVFLSDVRIPDELRLGEVGEGWRVALTTLGFERSGGSQHGSPGGSFRRLLGLARHLGVTDDAVVRQELAGAYITTRLLGFVNDRVRDAARAGQPPGPEGSIRKLLWTRNLTRIGELAAGMLGPAITADTGEWGTYAWAEHLLGAPGYRIAGGSDEIQRNIIAERVLGLPRGA